MNLIILAQRFIPRSPSRTMLEEQDAVFTTVLFLPLIQTQLIYNEPPSTTKRSI
jgi:hypothetical protein